MSPLLALLGSPLLAIVLERTPAIVAAVLVVVIVLVAWKFLKFAFKIALVVVAAVLIFLALQAAGVI